MNTIDTPSTTDPDWWRSAVVYQVYPRSFADSNGDGVGDIRGIIAHLDHIQGLGIDVIWLSPIYRSPQDDNGYDISDYRDVDPMFGTLSDLDDLISAVHQRGMRMILDLVVNHTSDEHPWFLDSRSGRDAEHADWYMWRDPRPGAVGGEMGAEPNNWESFFGGSAWEWVPERGQYYLHLFSKKQPDLNWENPDVRAAVFDMMTWWLDRGIDGFRMDVINFISKDPALPDGALLPNGYGDGVPFFRYGPRVHDYLAEMKTTVFDPRPATVFTVGEMPTVTPEEAARFTDDRAGQLLMVFQFEHVDLDHEGIKWMHRPATVVDLKHSLGRWQAALAEHGWNSLYWSNHDQPRAVSRWGDDAEHWHASATALAIVLHLHRGTPYVYQGEELGMTNGTFASIDDFRDIESLNYYAQATATQDPVEVVAAMARATRDNARSPMQWDPSPHAGFTTGEPWMPVNDNHVWLNAAAQLGDENSVYALYRRLIALRHSHPTVVNGAFRMLLPEHPQLYAFVREDDDARILVVANLSNESTRVELPEVADATLLLANIDPSDRSVLAPWQACVYELDPRP